MTERNESFRDEPPSYRPPALDEPGAVQVSPDDDPRPSSSVSLTADERQWGMFCHLSALVATALGGFAFLGPLVCWLIKKDTSGFVDRHGKEALNFQINMAVWVLISIPFAIITFGLGAILTVGIAVYSIVMAILAGLKANEGKEYQYPYIVRLVK